MDKRRSLMLLLVPFVVLAHGCADIHAYVRAEVIGQVSFDHNCPPERVKILREEWTDYGSVWGYRLDVCGKERRYRRVGDNAFIYVDVTDGGSPAVR